MVCLSFVLRGRHDLVVVGASHLNVGATLRPMLGWTWLAYQYCGLCFVVDLFV